MNYKTVKHSNGKYVVVETQTDQIMKVCDTNDEARKLMKHLNLGGGFDGFSPNFFTKPVKISQI